MMGLYRRFIARREWLRRDREETLVGTASYTTNYTDTGRDVEHLVSFFVDGNGVRYWKIDSGPKDHDKTAGRGHPLLRRDVFDWEHHGDTPDHIRRADARPRGKLIVFPGGGDAA